MRQGMFSQRFLAPFGNSFWEFHRGIRGQIVRNCETDFIYVSFRGERVSMLLKEVSDFRIVYSLKDGRVANLAMGYLRPDENLLGYFYTTFLFYAK